MKWSESYAKLLMVLHKHDMGYLLFDQVTTQVNHGSCKELYYEFYEKLQGLALMPFNSCDAHSIYLHQGHGFEILQAL